MLSMLAIVVTAQRCGTLAPAARQPGNAEQIGDCDKQAIEIPVVRYPVSTWPVYPIDQINLPAGPAAARDRAISNPSGEVR